MNNIYLLLIGSIKRFYLKKTFLNAFPPIYGIYSLYRFRKIDSILKIYCLTVAISFFTALLFSENNIHYWRYAQWFAIVGVAHGVLRSVDREKILKSLNTFDYIIVFQAIFEIIVPVYNSANTYAWGDRRIFGLFLDIPRLGLITGEPNFSGLLFIGILSFRMYYKDYARVPLYVLMVFLTDSRASVLALGIIMTLNLLGRFKRACFIFSFVFVICIIFYPLIILFFYNNLNPQYKRLLTEKLGTRVYIHAVYSKIGIENPVGIGLFHSSNFYADYIDKNMNLVNEITNEPEINEQHNLFVQVFSEVGWIAYFTFCCFWVFTIYKSRKNSATSILIIPLLFNSLFVNTINEIIIYIAIGIFLYETQNSEVNNAKSKNRVMHVSLRSDLSGGPKYITNLVSGLKDQFIWYIGAPEEGVEMKRWKNHLGLERFCFLPERSFQFPAFFKIIIFIIRNKIDILHSHGKGAGLYTRLIKVFIPNLKIVHTFHGIHEEYKGLARLLYRRAEQIMSWLTGRVIAVSVSEKKSLENDYKIKNITLILNSVPPSKFVYRPSTKKKINIITIGRFEVQKNYAFNLEIARFSAKKKLPLNFIWIGDGSLKEQFEKIVKQEKLRVEIKPATEKINKELKNSDVFFSTSLWEGMSLALLEAMSYGLPIVASNVIGNEDIVKESFGKLYTFDEKEKVIDSLMKYHSIKERITASKNSIIEYQENYNLEKNMHKFVNLYNSL